MISSPGAITATLRGVSVYPGDSQSRVFSALRQLFQFSAFPLFQASLYDGNFLAVLRYSLEKTPQIPSPLVVPPIRLIVKPENIAQLVFFIRGEKVMLDADLAMLYGVEARSLNQAVEEPQALPR